MKKINKIKIKINGKFIKIQDKTTLLNLVKKLEVPIIAHGAATLNGTRNRHAEKYAMANTPYD